MPYSYDITGSKIPGDIISVPYPFLSRSNVSILVDEVEVPTADYTWLTDGTIEAGAAFPAGTETNVKRTTPIDGLQGLLKGATSFKYRVANSNFTQLLYVLQERVDQDAAEASEVLPDGTVSYVKTSTNVQALLDRAYTSIQADDLAEVATSGSFNDLDDKPTIPSPSDVAYGASWDGNTESPTKNSVYSKIEALVLGTGSGDMTRSVYDPDQDGKVEAADVADVADAAPWGGLTGIPTTLAKTDVAQTFTALQASSVETLTAAAAMTPTGDKNLIVIPLDQNATIANMTTITIGATYVFKIPQDATGGRVPSWGSVYEFPGGIAFTLSTTANAVDIIAGTSFDGTSIQMFNPGLAFS